MVFCSGSGVACFRLAVTGKMTFCRQMNWTNFPGYTWLEYPTSRGMRFSSGQLFACLYQPRLFNSSERYQLSWWCLDSLVLLHYNQLPFLEATFRASITPTTMVSGEVWCCHQHCVSFISCTHLVLRILATRYPCDSRKHELVFNDVRLYHNFCTYLLRCMG